MRTRLSTRMHVIISICVTFFLITAASRIAGQTATEPGMLRNPLIAYGGADPWLTYYEGNYYLATTTWTSELTMRRSPTLAGLKTAEPVQIYFETDSSRCCNMWAPEFRLLDGPDGQHWYFYYTAGTRGTYDNQHTHVLESAGTDPMGPYTYKGQLFDPQNDSWAIDGSVLELNDALYFLFSAVVDNQQSLFIAPMSDPWTISGMRVRISTPEYDWETVGGLVNEGPVALHHDGRTFIIYSASFCNTPDYKLGMLTYNGGDPLSAESWVKSPNPVFERSDANGVYAPGHNGFFQSPDGTEDWIVYHANDSLDGGCDGGRTTRVQRIEWNADGTPDFGIPVSTDEEIAAPSGDTGVDPLPEIPAREISRFRSFSFENAYLRHTNFLLRLNLNVRPMADSQFSVVPGLADVEAVSIESINFPGFYLRHQGDAVLLNAYDGTDSFYADATWWIRPGLADSSWISLESYNEPGLYMGQQYGIMALVEVTDQTPQRALEEATLLQER